MDKNRIDRNEEGYLQPRIKISVNTDISVLEFYGYIGNIGKILVNIFTKISVKQKLTKKIL